MKLLNNVTCCASLVNGPSLVRFSFSGRSFYLLHNTKAQAWNTVRLGVKTSVVCMKIQSKASTPPDQSHAALTEKG